MLLVFLMVLASAVWAIFGLTAHIHPMLGNALFGLSVLMTLMIPVGVLMMRRRHDASVWLDIIGIAVVIVVGIAGYNYFNDNATELARGAPVVPAVLRNQIPMFWIVSIGSAVLVDLFRMIDSITNPER